MLGFYLFIGSFVAISASGNNGTITYVSATSSLSFLKCSNTTETYLSHCSNVQVVPFGFAGAHSIANISSTPATIQNMLFENDDNLTKLLCNHRENQHNKLCSYPEVENCTSRFPFFLKDVFPTEERIAHLQKIICGNRQKYDAKCVSSKMDEILSCANVDYIVDKAAKNAPMSVYTELLKNAKCVNYALGRVCARRFLESCGETTMQMYIESIPMYEECKGRSDFRLPDVDCSSFEGTRFSYLNCLHKTNLFLHVPKLSTSDAMIEFVLKTFTLDSNKAMCSKMQIYEEAINCTLNVQRECSVNAMKPTVPDTFAVIQGFKHLCQNLDDFNTPCVSTSTKSACTRRRRGSIVEQIILKHLCEDSSSINKCLVSTVRSCGAKTAAVYKGVLTSQLPHMCAKNYPAIVG